MCKQKCNNMCNKKCKKMCIRDRLHVRYTDGTEEVITTDETWHVRTGQIRYSEIYMGETIDTNAPNIREGKVSAVPEAVFHPTVLTPQLNEPVRVTERLKAKRVFTDSKGNIDVYKRQASHHTGNWSSTARFHLHDCEYNLPTRAYISMILLKYVCLHTSGRLPMV